MFTRATAEAASGQEANQMASANVLQFPRRVDDGDFYSQKFNVVEGAVEVPNAPDSVDYKVVVPHKLRSDVGRLIIAGFDGYYGAYDGLQEAMASNGEISIAFDTPRDGGRRNDIIKPQQVHTDAMAAVIEGLADNPALLDVPNGDRLSLSRVALVPHSMGSIPASRYSVAYPENVESISMMAGVGLDGRSALSLAPRVVRSLPTEIAGSVISGFGKHGSPLDIARSGVGHVLKNPLRAGSEVVSCSRADIRRDLEKLGGAGVKLAMINFEDDVLVPSQDSIDTSGHLVDYIDVLEGLNHLAPQRAPRTVAASLTAASYALAGELLSVA